MTGRVKSIENENGVIGRVWGVGVKVASLLLSLLNSAAGAHFFNENPFPWRLLSLGVGFRGSARTLIVLETSLAYP